MKSRKYERKNVWPVLGLFSDNPFLSRMRINKHGKNTVVDNAQQCALSLNVVTIVCLLNSKLQKRQVWPSVSPITPMVSSNHIRVELVHPGEGGRHV